MGRFNINICGRRNWVTARARLKRSLAPIFSFHFIFVLETDTGRRLRGERLTYQIWTHAWVIRGYVTVTSCTCCASRLDRYFYARTSPCSLPTNAYCKPTPCSHWSSMSFYYIWLFASVTNKNMVSNVMMNDGRRRQKRRRRSSMNDAKTHLLDNETDYVAQKTALSTVKAYAYAKTE